MKERKKKKVFLNFTIHNIHSLVLILYSSSKFSFSSQFKFKFLCCVYEEFLTIRLVGSFRLSFDSLNALLLCQLVVQTTGRCGCFIAVALLLLLLDDIHFVHIVD